MGGIEILQQDGHVFPKWVNHILNVRALQCQMENLLTPVMWVRFATYVSSSLQPRDHSGDRATRQASDRTEIAPSHRSPLAQQVEALVIGWTEPEALGDRVVKQHYRCAVLARQSANDLVGQLVLALACSPHRIRSYVCMVLSLSS
jgi:hypothetical protein